MQVGVIATLVDLLAGALTIRAIYPDWAATSNLSLHTTGRANAGRVSVVGFLVRAGSTMTVVDLNIFEESGDFLERSRSIGCALVTFSKLTRRKDPFKGEFAESLAHKHQFAFEGSGLIQPYLQEVGVRVLDELEGVVEVPMNDYIRNRFGALQGGIVATMADVAGQHAARAATDRLMLTSDLEIHYLSQGKVGPFRTKTTVIRAGNETVLTRVEVFDTGAHDSLIGVAMNGAIVSHKIEIEP
jgi:uncharacterized protein (TIGR00369 family)